MFGTPVSDLQEDIEVSKGKITGTLKYLSEGDLVDAWGAGHFLALKFGEVPEGVTVSAGLDPSKGSGLVPLDEDMNGAWKITGNHAQKFKVVATDGTNTETQTFSLSGLTLLEEE